MSDALAHGGGPYHFFESRFPAPIYANLVDAEEGYSLVWSRNTRTAH